MLKRAGFEYYADDLRRYGRMNDPTASAFIKGQCGDTQEIYLYIKDHYIEEARFFADGCAATFACGAYVIEWAEGMKVMEALELSAGKVLQGVKGIPEDHYHCAVLAMMTLYKAIGGYLLLP